MSSECLAVVEWPRVSTCGTTSHWFKIMLLLIITSQAQVQFVSFILQLAWQNGQIQKTSAGMNADSYTSVNALRSRTEHQANGTRSNDQHLWQDDSKLNICLWCNSSH